MEALKEIQRAEHEYIKRCGGYWELSEFDREINEFSRAKVRAFKHEHEEAWLGNVNLYSETPPNFTEYESGITALNNFGYAFVIPHPDQELYKLITQRDEADYTGTKADAPMIDAIFNRIEDIGGIVLNWV